MTYTFKVHYANGFNTFAYVRDNYTDAITDLLKEQKKYCKKHFAVLTNIELLSTN